MVKPANFFLIITEQKSLKKKKSTDLFSKSYGKNIFESNKNPIHSVFKNLVQELLQKIKKYLLRKSPKRYNSAMYQY